MRLLVIPTSVGLPAPAAIATWSNPRSKACSCVSVPPKRVPRVDAKRAAPREIQVEEVEEVLVPPHRDAVLGDAAETRERALVERAEERLRIANQLRGTRRAARELLGQRLDLQAVDRDDPETLIQEMVREGVAGRPEPDDEDVLSVVRKRVRARRVERVPAGQERPDLEPPGHREDVRENAGLRLRDVDGILRLKDAGLHAVVADAMPGAGNHRIVEADERKGADRVPLTPQQVHFRDLLVQRAARERHAERIRANASVLLPKALRARVLVALVAEDAVMRLAGDLARGLARVGEREAVARARVRR